MMDLCFKVWTQAKPSRSSINISVSTFVPKPMTPFQWVGQLPRPDIEGRLNEIREKLGRRGMRFKWHEPAHSVLEAVFARGDGAWGRFSCGPGNWERGSTGGPSISGRDLGGGFQRGGARSGLLRPARPAARRGPSVGSPVGPG